MSNIDSEPNEDAIYAALCWWKRNQGRAELTPEQVLAQRASAPGEFIPGPRYKLTREEADAIYPGEPDSVLNGITIARAIFDNPGLAATMAKGNGAIGKAVRRFLDDEAALGDQKGVA